MASASSSSSAIAPCPDSRAINRDRVAITRNPSATRQRPGHHRRGHLAHRMTDHRIGLHPVGAPQRGQRQLHPHQHRLHPLDRRLTGSPLGDHLLQRKPDLLNEHRLQLGDRRSERRLIGQQLPTHPGPLRTLTRIHKHRARPTRPVMGTHHPSAGAPAANARSPATAWSRSRAHTVANSA